MTWCAKLRVYKRLERLVAIIILVPSSASSPVLRSIIVVPNSFSTLFVNFLLFSTASFTWPRCGDRSALTNTLDSFQLTQLAQVRTIQIVRLLQADDRLDLLQVFA